RVPQPEFADIGRLVADVRAAGVPVDYRPGTAFDAPPVVGRTAYRVVQEGLTNALRHGDTSQPVLLGLRWDESGVAVDLVNTRRDDVPPPDSHAFRHGIPGMRERAQLAGGSLQAVAGDDGMFRLSARIPARTGRTP
ncbi:MAG TPA: two-component sensor histidine kinase, partial [Agromyces sp.]